jgi:hypothetical protein
MRSSWGGEEARERRDGAVESSVAGGHGGGARAGGRGRC